MPRYNPAVIEPKWQKFWENGRTFKTPAMPEEGAEKAYILDMFPYPSGNGLHVGHPEGYTATDIVSRYSRMLGKTVMHTMGYDAFGLPAENHAKKTGTHPRITTEQNIATFRRQLKMIGFSYDWDRELSTTDVDYFRWTQHIFLVLFDTWYDPTFINPTTGEKGCGRPIAELPIPEDVRTEGKNAIEEYIDDFRLAYQCETPVNWCPELGTVLANEEVIGGLSEVGGHPVVRLPLRQWMLRITAYADRLESDLESLDWSESIKASQRNWIGRSTGAEVDFFIGTSEQRDAGTPSNNAFNAWKQGRSGTSFPRKPGDDTLRIYTTRPDTLFGATYMVIAPEHRLVDQLTTAGQTDEIKKYCDAASTKSDLDRTELAKEKTGVFTGSYAINPVNGQPVPIWVADYVLVSYGTGAIMAVPAHDSRDFEFAMQFRLPVICVVDPGETDQCDREQLLAGKIAFTANGTAINSGKYDGLSTPEFKQQIAADLTDLAVGKSAVNYKLRDWLFSRQHFWGEPFPILHELDASDKPTGRLRAVEMDQLPVDLPKIDRFDFEHGSPEPPLEKSPAEWLYVTLDGKRYKRETNTMPQWAGSCWYYLRFLDPNNSELMIDPEIEKAWMPVDLYVGGAEHAVLHLLYARFWHKVLLDRGYVTTVEPFQKLVNQGMILGEIEFTGYKQDGQWVTAGKSKEENEQYDGEKLPETAVVKSGDGFVLTDEFKAEQGIDSTLEIKVGSRAHKMSKSRGNVINPDVVVKDYGADSLRLYEMFMGPLETVKPWSMDGVGGVRNFLDRVWRMTIDENDEEKTVLHPALTDTEPSEDQNRMLHRTIKAVTHDLDTMGFNTAISRMMEFTNFFLKQESRPKSVIRQFILLLAPFAPHMAEELWALLGGEDTLAYEPWPKFDEAAIRESTIEIPVQIMGKLRAKIKIAADADVPAMIAAAKAEPKIAELLDGKRIIKEVAVPGRMVNFVAK